MAARKKSARKKSSRTPLKLTQAAILEDTASGPRRAALFLKPEPEKPYKFRLRFLPGLAERGPNNVNVPYFRGMQHWYPIHRDDGTSYHAGIACIDFMRRQHPAPWKRWQEVEINAVVEDRPCLTCEILNQEALEDDAGDMIYPRLVEYMRFGKPVMYWSTSYSFAVIDREREQTEDDPHLVKIFPANKTIKEQVMNLADPDGPYPYLFDPEEGNDLLVRRYGGTPWKFTVTPFEATEIGIDDWEAECPDLDMVCPNWWTRQEQEEWWEKHLPDVLRTKPTVNVTVSSPAPKKRSTRKSAAKKVAAKKVTRRKRGARS